MDQAEFGWIWMGTRLDLARSRWIWLGLAGEPQGNAGKHGNRGETKGNMGIMRKWTEAQRDVKRAGKRRGWWEGAGRGSGRRTETQRIVRKRKKRREEGGRVVPRRSKVRDFRVGRWDQEPWFTGTMVIVTEQKMTKYRTIVSSRMGSDFNEKTN